MKIFVFSFKMAIKTAGSAQIIRVGQVSGNTAFFFLARDPKSHKEDTKSTDTKSDTN